MEDLCSIFVMDLEKAWHIHGDSVFILLTSGIDRTSKKNFK